MAVKERVVNGTLYFGDCPIDDVSGAIFIEATEEHTPGQRVEPQKINMKLSGSVGVKSVIRVNRLALLSMLYGMTITNNWLKMHGGIKVRQVAGRKHKRKQ